MKVCVVLSERPEQGGVFQYARMLLTGLHRLVADGTIEEASLAVPGAGKEDVVLDGVSWKVRPLPKRNVRLGSVSRRLRHALGRRRQRPIPDWTRIAPPRSLDGVDLLIHPSPGRWQSALDLPFVIAIHDLQHRLQPEFPEMSLEGVWASREVTYRGAALAAEAVLVDSEVGRSQTLEFYGPYGLRPERVHPLPFVPPPYLDPGAVTAVDGLPGEFLFYPAQFWSHKNHARLIQALERIRLRKGVSIPVVLCGSHAGALREGQFHLVQQMIALTGSAGQVHYRGYVSDEEMSRLYSRARALVMPTYCGPTNIPVVEAWQHGCPVITSDIEGIREQVGDAGLLVDPRSTEALADAILQVWNDPLLRADLARKGKRKAAAYGQPEFNARLKAILVQVQSQLGLTPAAPS